MADEEVEDAPALEGHESASKMSDPTPAAPEEAPDEEGGEVESVNVRRAEGGFIASCQRRQTGGPYVSPKEYVFQDIEEALDYARSELVG